MWNTIKGLANIKAYLIIFGLLLIGFVVPAYLTTAPAGLFESLRFLLITFLFVISFVRKKMSLWIFSAMVLGIEVGMDFPAFALEMERLAKIFLRLIKTLVAPLIFATLVVGIAGHSNLKQVGRMGLKSIIYFEIVTTLALFIGLMAINITQAGKGVSVEVNQKVKEKSTELLAQRAEHKDHIVEIFPENIAKSIAENSVLQIVVFSVIFAIGLGMVKNEQHKLTMLRMNESLAEVMFKFTDIVMYLAPLAVFGALASTVAKSGVDVLMSLMKLVGTLYASLVVFILAVLLPIALLAKIPIRKFLNAVSEPVSLAFATASSEAALPKAMENLERFGIPKHIVGFVIPTGYSFNLDGTTLYLSLASVFIAQMSGINLSIGEQISICLVLMLTSKGVAGVRGASFVILAGTVASMGLDPEKASVILGIDAVMDMARTSVNVLGNCLATAVIARSEGELDHIQA
ncbi:MAG: cation:dicarboxylase symporter family transporter [Crocinitomicaceae bacterium]|jgi:proton glutamate symport protein|nr:cation:dicarboxylase symporter family transporter [Cryomorphaceae bacterium]MCF8270011.1 cation:dicarboxylase symporter family transporter [Crocinitomicaceae bacterium]